MITSVHGTLEACRANQALVRVDGLSLQVFAPSSTLQRLPEPGAPVSLYTHFHVREDGMALYGFLEEEDRNAFQRLLTVGGVGPKVALALLSAMDAPTLYQAVADEDQQQLGQAPGVGKRLAARLILELKGKLPSLSHMAGTTGAGKTAAGLSGKRSEALEALVGLGYSSAEAQTALAKIAPDEAMTLEQLVTSALRTFSLQ